MQAVVFGELAERKSTILQYLNLQPRQYLLVTVHRAENTDDPCRLQAILNALQQLSGTWTVIFPIHPRTRAKIDELNLQSNIQHLQTIPPASFLDMVQLEKSALCILTDSGGVQKEAYFHGVPCVTLRDETEWVETVAAGWNQVVGADSERVIAAVDKAAFGQPIAEYGNGRVAEQIVTFLQDVK